MEKRFALGVLLAMAAPHLAISQPAREAVLAAETAFAAAAARNGTSAAFLAHSTAGSVVADNGRLRSAQAVWRTRPHQRGTQLAWRPVLADAAQSGELGYTTGPWLFSRKGESMAAGDYLTVWRKQPDGQWKFAIDMGTEHGGTPPEPTEAARPQLFAAGATPVAVPGNAILAIDQKFAAAQLHAPAKTYRETISAEARLYRPGQLPLLGTIAQAAVESFSQPYLFVATDGYLAASGDLGYVYGTLRRTAANPKDPEETGSFLRIWRREAVAGWRIVAEVVNVTSPTAESLSATKPAAASTGQ